MLIEMKGFEHCRILILQCSGCAQQCKSLQTTRELGGLFNNTQVKHASGSPHELQSLSVVNVTGYSC